MPSTTPRPIVTGDDAPIFHVMTSATSADAAPAPTHTAAAITPAVVNPRIIMSATPYTSITSLSRRPAPERANIFVVFLSGLRPAGQPGAR